MSLSKRKSAWVPMRLWSMSVGNFPTLIFLRSQTQTHSKRIHFWMRFFITANPKITGSFVCKEQNQCECVIECGKLFLHWFYFILKLKLTLLKAGNLSRLFYFYNRKIAASAVNKGADIKVKREYFESMILFYCIWLFKFSKEVINILPLLNEIQRTCSTT